MIPRQETKTLQVQDLIESPINMLSPRESEQSKILSPRIQEKCQGEFCKMKISGKHNIKKKPSADGLYTIKTRLRRKMRKYIFG